LTSNGDQRNQLSQFIPFISHISRKLKRQLNFTIFFLAITVEGKNLLRLPHFISFIQEAKNNIHVIIDAWQLYFQSALNSMGKLDIRTFFHKTVPQNLYEIHKRRQKRSQIKLFLL